MVTRSNLTSEQKCHHYAQFASRLEVVPFDIVYWLLFTLVLLMLFTSSWYFDRTMSSVEKFPPKSPDYRRQMKKCMIWCTACAAISVTAVVMETFCLLALQFCDGEDLMMLYWSTWTMLQVGSVIAIFGVMLSVFHVLRERKAPPWGLALGTPVLVVAGLGHFFNSCLVKRVKTLKKEKKRMPRDLAISQSTTLREQSPDNDRDDAQVAKLLGHTPDGGAIIQFSHEPASLRQQGSVLCVSKNGEYIVSFGREADVGKIATNNNDKTRPDSVTAKASTPSPQHDTSTSVSDPQNRKESVGGITLIPSSSNNGASPG